jgi:hypothetical protein
MPRIMGDLRRMDGWILFRPEALSLKGQDASYIIPPCDSALISYKPIKVVIPETVILKPDVTYRQKLVVS